MTEENVKPEITETCRCGASLRLVGSMATDERVREWRDNHMCIEPAQDRFRSQAGHYL